MRRVVVGRGRCCCLPSVSFETLLPRVSFRQLPIARSFWSTWLIDNPVLKECRIWRIGSCVVRALCSWPRSGRRRRRCRSLSLSCETTSFPCHTFIGNIIVANMRWTNGILLLVVVVVVVVVVHGSVMQMRLSVWRPNCLTYY